MHSETLHHSFILNHGNNSNFKTAKEIRNKPNKQNSSYKPNNSNQNRRQNVNNIKKQFELNALVNKVFDKMQDLNYTIPIKDVLEAIENVHTKNMEFVMEYLISKQIKNNDQIHEDKSKWKCTQCTYLNENTMKKCEICEHPKRGQI